MLHFVQEGNLMDVNTSDLEWETFSESSSNEDHEDVDYLFGGQARTIFSSLQESIGKIDDFLSFERIFVYGEIVRYAAFPSGQMGRVTGIDMFVDLENLHGKVLKNVNTKKLSKFCSISENDYVILGPWLGRVNKVVDNVIIVFDDGTRCEVSAPEKEKVVPINSDLLEDSQYPYYPGQRVRIKSPNSSKPTGWLCGNWKENQVEGTILSVEAGSVYVTWFASALSGSDQSLPMPPCLQDSKQITLLSCFSHANWQLGDWCVVPPISDCKLLMGQYVFDSAIADTDKEQANIGRGLKEGNFGSFDEVYCIVKTKTKVDILWQDGTHSVGLDSQNLLPVSVTNAHEFWPMQFVIERGSFDDPRKSTSRRWGVVQSMDAKERTVRLQWQSIPITETEDFAGDRLEETVSAYELIEHPDYSYCYGDIVFKAAQKQLGYLANQDHSKSITGLNAGAAFKDRLCINCGNDLPDKCYLCCIGNVTGFGDGTVDVKWANGFTMKVAPHEIFKIDKNEDSSSTSVLNEANADVLTREMVEHEDSYQIKKGKGLSSFDSEEKSFQKHPQESRSFVLPRAAMEFFSSIKMSIFRSLGVTSMSKSFSVLHDAIDGREPEKLNKKGLLEASDLFADPEESELQSAKASSDEEGTEFQEQKYISSPRNGDLSDHFKQFGIISDCADHQFFNASKWSTLSQPTRGWMKKVQQEWSILEKNLPETIYVRVYEERMDLLRAAIIGAPGTPYHDGIFFFDICFPPEYPYQPPMVHYYSGGLRVNPNLYESGKVCLSLLNTWTGSGTEVWNPSSSTVLQVLLSLQALVLNDKPYFNEAGYDKQIGRVEGEKNSVSYNENAFLLSCKTMLYILKKPPKHFEALVQEHFNKRAQYIMLACKSYLEGASMGCASGCESEQESGKGTSTGFKIMLGKLFPKLVEAFSENGIDLQSIQRALKMKIEYL